MSDDFYIGYRKNAPANLAQFVRAVAVGVIILVVAVAALVGASQQPAGNGSYDFGGHTRFEGKLFARPVPAVVVTSLDGKPVEEQIALLVNPGKHAASVEGDAEASDVRLTGAKIARDGVHMIEIDSISVIPHSKAIVDYVLPNPNDTISVEGELVDLKCYLGVMNPANGKVHRGCAALCLRGGVPAGVVVSRPHAPPLIYVLGFAAPGAPTLNPEWAGRAVRVTGTPKNPLGISVLNVKEIALR